MISRSENSTEFDKQLGAKIRDCRRSLGYSQEKVVQELAFYGVDLFQQTLMKIERGLRTVYPNELIALAKILNIDLAALDLGEIPPCRPFSLKRP